MRTRLGTWRRTRIVIVSRTALSSKYWRCCQLGPTKGCRRPRARGGVLAEVNRTKNVVRVFRLHAAHLAVSPGVLPWPTALQLLSQRS